MSSLDARRADASDKLEVVIADVTSKKGKIFNGSGDGFRGKGRQDAWLGAMDDLRKNLGDIFEIHAPAMRKHVLASVCSRNWIDGCGNATVGMEPVATPTDFS